MRRSVDTNTPYYTVNDRHGGRADVVFGNDGKHKIMFYEPSGKKFFTEVYDDLPIGFVEDMANEWVSGGRELVGI